MNKLYETTCPKCGARLAIFEQGAVGMAGCYEREEANCPICNTVVGCKRTDGVLAAVLLSIIRVHRGRFLILRSHIYRKILNGFIACKDIRFF